MSIQRMIYRCVIICCVLFLFVTPFISGNTAEALILPPLEDAKNNLSFEELIDYARKTNKTAPEEALIYAQEALQLGQQKQNIKMISQAQMELASAYYGLQNFSNAIEYAKFCEPYFEKSNDVETLSTLYNLISICYFSIGNSEESDIYSDKSIELAEKYKILDVLLKQYYNRGAIAFYRGDYSYSMDFALKALTVAKKLKHQFYMAHCYDLLGSLSKQMTRYQEAANYFNRSLKIYHNEDQKVHMGATYFNVASIYNELNKRDSARLCYYNALKYYKEAESDDGIVISTTGLATYYLEVNNLDSAQLYIEKSLNAATLIESVKDMFLLYYTAGNISLEKGDFRKAKNYYNKALSLARQNRNDELESVVKLNISKNFAATNRFDSAYYFLLQSYNIKDSLQNNDEIYNRAYTFAEHLAKEKIEKEMIAEQLQRRLGIIIMFLCIIVILILCFFIRMMYIRQKEINIINAELDKYRKVLEHNLQTTTRELALSEQQIMNLSNNLPDGVIFRFAFDNEHTGKTLYVGANWEELTGQSIEEAKENSLFFFRDRVHPDDRDELLEALAHAIRKHDLLDITCRFCKKSDETRWFHIRAVAIEAHDELVYLDGFLVDDSKQKQFEQELLEAKNKAEESDKLKSTFLANMSHEILTPMNAIVGFASELLKKTFSLEKQHKYLKLMEMNSQRLRRLIANIVEISIIESNQLTLRMETFPLSKVIAMVKEHFDIIINEGGYKSVELLFDDELLQSSMNVHADIFRLKQIFLILIENALQFTEKGFVRCGIIEDPYNAAHCFVMDTGIGIASEKMDVIFQTFSKLNEYSEGAGLGLTIVKKLIQMLGGDICVESEPGIGSNFIFTIPGC